MRYLFTLLILFVQVVTCFTASAGTSLPANNIAHEKSSSLLANDHLIDHFAEIAYAIQFNCVAFNGRDHRDTDGSIMVARLSNYMAGDLRKRVSAFPTPHWSSFRRLLLFPNHYFW
ncbi:MULTISPECIES: hypothetical protein [Niastella]|uniref:Uncharacterized protein n=1 Tax=Niastella soli TaxID=2821487 RepID=A0ABS3YZI1_9BACT|nr:hypothetical protein [Niastella soli]MBO9203333.1 hypothetical protein [Niastella soli]